MVEQEGAMSHEARRYEDGRGRQATVERDPDGGWHLVVRNGRGPAFWSQRFEDEHAAKLSMWRRWPDMREVVA